MKKVIVLSLFILIGIFIHDIVRLIICSFIKTQFSTNYIFNLRYFIGVAFMNSIPFLLICVIVLTKGKGNKSVTEDKEKVAGIVTSAIGVIIVNIFLHFDYWMQLCTGKATSTIALGLPLIPFIAVILIPVFYWFGKNYLAKYIVK